MKTYNPILSEYGTTSVINTSPDAVNLISRIEAEKTA